MNRKNLSASRCRVFVGLALVGSLSPLLGGCAIIVEGALNEKNNRDYQKGRIPADEYRRRSDEISGAFK